jgi:hypothetical protein
MLKAYVRVYIHSGPDSATPYEQCPEHASLGFIGYETGMTNRCVVGIPGGKGPLERLKKTPWPLVRKRTIATERRPLVGKVSANFCG